MNGALGLFGAFVFVVLLLGLVAALPVMLLWNWCLVGAVSGVNEIGFFQAYGLYILGNFLFKATTTIKKND